jgi:hypothetical protein
VRESRGSTKPKGEMKVKAASRLAEVGSRPSGRAHYWPVSVPSWTRRSKSVHVGTRKMVNYA